MTSNLIANQLRAARAWLNWSRDDLAEKAGVVANTIAAIEKGDGASEPNARTMAKITGVLKQRGINFSDSGIEYSEYPVYFLQGSNPEETYLQLLQDAFEHLSEQKNSELLIMYSDDRESPATVNAFYRKMRSAGIQMRQLIQDGNTYIMGPLDEYRYVPKEFFINRVTLVYGNRIANLTGDFSKVIVRNDAINAAIQRNTFNLLWSTLKPPTQTTANERF